MITSSTAFELAVEPEEPEGSTSIPPLKNEDFIYTHLKRVVPQENIAEILSLDKEQTSPLLPPETTNITIGRTTEETEILAISPKGTRRYRISDDGSVAIINQKEGYQYSKETYSTDGTVKTLDTSPGEPDNTATEIVDPEICTNLWNQCNGLISQTEALIDPKKDHEQILVR